MHFPFDTKGVLLKSLVYVLFYATEVLRLFGMFERNKGTLLIIMPSNMHKPGL